MRRPADQRHPRASGGEGGCNRMPLLTGRTVAEETHGINRFRRRPTGNDRVFATKCAGCRRGDAAKQCNNIRRFRHAPDAIFTAGHITRGWLNHANTVFFEVRNITLRRCVRPHFVIHRGRNKHRLIGRKQRGRRKIICNTCMHFCQNIRTCRRDQNHIRHAREFDMAHLDFIGERKQIIIGLRARERRYGKRRNELCAPARENRMHGRALRAQQPNQLQRFIRRNRAGDNKQNTAGQRHRIPVEYMINTRIAS